MFDFMLTRVKDINLASTRRYLILPNKHVNNAKELYSTDAQLCKYKRDNLIWNLNFVRENRTVTIFRRQNFCHVSNVIAERQGLDLTVVHVQCFIGHHSLQCLIFAISNERHAMYFTQKSKHRSHLKRVCFSTRFNLKRRNRRANRTTLLRGCARGLTIARRAFL